MESIFEFFTTIAKDYGITVVILFLLIFLIVSGMYFIVKTFPDVIRKYIEDKLTENHDLHKKAALKRKNVCPQITKLLTELVSDVKGDRALLLEFSNGSANLVGLPFLFVSATSEALNQGVSSVAHIYQRVSISLFSKFLADLEDKGYFYVEDIEEIKIEYPVIYNFMKPNGVKTALFYAIYGVDQTLGFIVVTTTNNNTFTRKNALPRAAETAQLISFLLNLDDLEEK